MKQLWKVQCVSPSGAVSCLLLLNLCVWTQHLLDQDSLGALAVVMLCIGLWCCCPVVMLQCYSVTVLQWQGESREGECYRFHGVIPESEGSPTLPTLPDPQYLSTLTSPIISISILPCSVIISNRSQNQNNVQRIVTFTNL